MFSLKCSSEGKIDMSFTLNQKLEMVKLSEEVRSKANKPKLSHQSAANVKEMLLKEI